MPISFKNYTLNNREIRDQPLILSGIVYKSLRGYPSFLADPLCLNVVIILLVCACTNV